MSKGKLVPCRSDSGIFDPTTFLRNVVELLSDYMTSRYDQSRRSSRQDNSFFAELTLELDPSLTPPPLKFRNGCWVKGWVSRKFEGAALVAGFLWDGSCCRWITALRHQQGKRSLAVCSHLALLLCPLATCSSSYCSTLNAVNKFLLNVGNFDTTVCRHTREHTAPRVTFGRALRAKRAICSWESTSETVTCISN
jgi:hypothetical protein